MQSSSGSTGQRCTTACQWQSSPSLMSPSVWGSVNLCRPTNLMPAVGGWRRFEHDDDHAGECPRQGAKWLMTPHPFRRTFAIHPFEFGVRSTIIETTMRYVFVFLAAPLLAFAQATPKASGVLNGASFSGNLCPGALASLFGTDLATGTTAAQSLPLPTDLLGTKVLVQDPSLPNPIIAPLYFVSPGQVNFQIPFEVVRNNITISVSTPQGTSNALNVSPVSYTHLRAH